MMRTVVLVLLAAAGVAQAGPTATEVSAGPAYRHSTDTDNEGLALHLGHGARDRGWAWNLDLVYTSGSDPHTEAVTLRFGWEWGFHIAPWLTLAPGLTLGVDGDSFPGDSGYTDGALHLVCLGAGARAIVDVSSNVFLAIGGDGDLRLLTIGNFRRSDGFAYDAILFAGVRG